jgi:hypothetical protein
VTRVTLNCSSSLGLHVLTLEHLELLSGRVTRRDPLRLSLRLPEGRTD